MLTDDNIRFRETLFLFMNGNMFELDDPKSVLFPAAEIANDLIDFGSVVEATPTITRVMSIRADASGQAEGDEASLDEKDVTHRNVLLVMIATPPPQDGLCIKEIVPWVGSETAPSDRMRRKGGITRIVIKLVFGHIMNHADTREKILPECGKLGKVLIRSFDKDHLHSMSFSDYGFIPIQCQKRDHTIDNKMTVMKKITHVILENDSDSIGRRR